MSGTVEVVPGTAPPVLRLILPDQIVQLLRGVDSRLKRLSILLIKNLFGRVSYFDYWFGHFIPMAEGRAFTMRERIALELVQRFASHYYGSVKASQAAHEMDLHDGEPLSSHAVSIALAALEAARQQCKSKRNVDALMADVIPTLDLLLGTMAGYCGPRSQSGANLHLSNTSPTCEHVVGAGLWDWLCVFAQDLDRHYQSIASESSSVDQVLALSEHVERVLWQFGIFLSDVEGGRLWIDVCDDVRLSIVKQMLNS